MRLIEAEYFKTLHFLPMKILMLNQDWFASELREAGHEVFTVGIAEHLDLVLPVILVHINDVFKLLNFGVPDALIIHDNSSPIIFRGLERLDVPIFFYSVDTHHHLKLHQIIATSFDVVAVAQKDYLHSFNKAAEAGVAVQWLPLWASREIEACNEKQFEVSFVGSLNSKLNPDRVEFFDSLKARVPIHITTGEFWKIFPFSKIVINQTVKKDLNFRVFEAMISGTVLLTEHVENGLFDLFQEGTHLVTYKKGDVDDAVEKINILLSNPERCRKIGEEGRNEIMRHHLSIHRAAKVLKQVEEMVSKPKKEKKPCYFVYAINFTVIGKILFKTNPCYAAKAFEESLQLISKALAVEEDLENEYEFYVLLCCYGHGLLFKNDAGSQQIKALFERYPQRGIFAVAELREAANRGDVEQIDRIMRDYLIGVDREFMIKKSNEMILEIISTNLPY
jgi:hypothetical protein